MALRPCAKSAFKFAETMGKSDGVVQVTTAEGVKEEIAELTAASPEDDQSRRAEVEALKLAHRRVVLGVRA